MTELRTITRQTKSFFCLIGRFRQNNEERVLPKIFGESDLLLEVHNTRLDPFILHRLLGQMPVHASEFYLQCDTAIIPKYSLWIPEW